MCIPGLICVPGPFRSSSAEYHRTGFPRLEARPNMEPSRGRDVDFEIELALILQLELMPCGKL